MTWFIVYRGKTERNTLIENLSKAGINYYEAKQEVEHFEDGRMVLSEERVLKNLIFVQTDRNIAEVIKDIDGLKAPYINRATGKPATVSDDEMHRFMDIVKLKNLKAEFLHDSYRRFTTGQKVRVRAGEFSGLEGYVFRMRGDRKLVIALGDMAIAVTGIHHTLFEPIE